MPSKAIMRQATPPLPRLIYTTCKYTTLYQTVCEIQVGARPCPLACDVADGVLARGSNCGMRLVHPMGATRTVCACAGIAYRAARSCVCVPRLSVFRSLAEAQR